METKIIAVFVIVFLMMGLVEFVAAGYVVIKSRNLPEQKEREDMEQIEYLKTYQKKQQEKLNKLQKYEEIFEAAKIKRENYYIDKYEREVDEHVLQNRSTKQKC